MSTDLMSSVMPFIQGGSGILGTIGNIQGNEERNKVLSSEMGQMNTLQNMTPTQYASGIQKFQQPLSQGLQSSVGNMVQGSLAERGLAQAPGIYAQTLSQGLAPYQLQEQQIAQNAFFQSLGLPIQARPSPFGPFPQQTNTSSIWESLMSPGGAMGRSGGGYGSYGSYGGGMGGGANPGIYGVPGYGGTGAGSAPAGYGGLGGAGSGIDLSQFGSGGGVDMSSLMGFGGLLSPGS